MKKCPKCSESIKKNTAFCPSCGEKVGRQSAEEKRARFSEENKGNKVPLFAIGALVAAVAIGAGGYLLFRAPAGTSVAASTSQSSSGPESVSFPMETFDDGQAKYFSYDAPSGKTIKFFVIKSSDGIVRAAFDACDVCFASKKGYRQEGDFMVCNNCGQKFLSTRVNEVKGGCNPSPLERTVEDGTLVIAVSDILTGARYF